MSRKIRISGDCQTPATVEALRLLLPSDDIEILDVRDLRPEAKEPIFREIESIDVWATAHWHYVDEARSRNPGLLILKWPQLKFSAFHPDIVLASTPEKSVTAMGCVYNSAICLWGWLNGVPRDRIAKLFCAQTFNALGYFDQWNPCVTAMSKSFEECELDFHRFFQPVKRQGVFMHSSIHAKLSPIVHISRQLAEKLGVDSRSLDDPLEDYMADPLIFDSVWPVYPEIGDNLSIPSSYRWKFREKHCSGLLSYIETSYSDYEAQHIDAKCGLRCETLNDYDAILARQLELQK